MPEPSFQTTNPVWSTRQFRQRVGEWFEWVTQSDDRRPDLDLPDWSIPFWLLQSLFWLLVGAIVTWLLWRLFNALQPYVLNWRSRRVQQLGQQIQADPNRWPVAVWMQRVQTLQQQGNYTEACRALYMGLLQLLHDRQVAPHRDSRTDGEYRHRLQRLSPQAAYRDLIDIHERIHFGDAVATATEFQQCQQAFERIQQNS